MMRRYFISVLLLATSFNLFAQAFRIDVDNEPLNKVLNRLGLEISFDDRALSAYNVSAAKSFENPEKALRWLLDEKPFRIEKIGKVYVIIPLNNLQQNTADIASHIPENDGFVFRGTVVSRTTNEPLEYATVSLLDEKNILLISGITTQDGRFSIRESRFPAKIKISYLGYETLIREMENRNGELGIFPLSEEAILLDETVVTADNLQPAINRSTYSVTAEMRRGTDNALDLLNKIPGVSFDYTSKTVQLNHDPNILLLVDGIQQSGSYLQHLASGRVQAIEVVYAVSGRFVSDDYAGIIHFILKKDYTGYDIHISDASSLNLSKTADYNRLSENSPSAGFIYTTRKLNFFGMYDYERENRNIRTAKALTFSLSDLESVFVERPNNLYENESFTITGGLNYHITPLQLLGIQADYTSGNEYTAQNYTMRRTDFSQNYDRLFTNISENRIHAHAFTGSVFYQGQVADRLHLYGDFSFNYYYNDLTNEYRQDEVSNYRYLDLWDEYKNQTAFNAEARYDFSEKWLLEAGYSNIWRRYGSNSSQGTGFPEYNEHRNKAFAYLTRNFSDKAGLKAGIALEHILQQNAGSRHNYLFRALPFVQFDSEISRTVTVAAGYAANQSYPSLYQLSPMSIVIDTFLTQTGNPNLKSAVRQQVFVEFSLWNRLKITPQFNYISDGISEVYDRIQYKLYRTFENVNFREYSLHASYEQKFGTYFRLNGAVTLYRSEALHKGIRSFLNGWLLNSEVDYYHPEASAGLRLGYYRNMKRNILWQGYQMSDRDYWSVTARKELWNDRIFVTLSYIPPIVFGVRYNRTKELNTPLYKEKTVVDLKSCNQMLMLKISIRFERGSVKPTKSRTGNSTDEREK